MSSLLKLVVFLGLTFATSFARSDDPMFAYNGFSNTNLELDGTASITENGLLELTNGKVMSKGHAFFPDPLRFRRSPNSTVQSFSASFVFGIISVYNNLSSHGLAMFVAPGKDFSAATPVGYLGLFNAQNDGNGTNRVFALELDTYQNSEFQDIDNNHVGINVNGLHSVESHAAGFYRDRNGTSESFEDLTLCSQQAMQVWVDYDSESARISSTVAPLNKARPKRPTVSASYNLSAVLADVAYVGFSSSTGKINSRHYVLGWSFAMNGPAPAIDTSSLPKLPLARSKPHRPVLEVVLPVATAALLVAAGAVVFLSVRRHIRYAELREDWEVEFGPHRFSYKDLFRATEGFGDKNLLGTGGFGRVYRGVLPRSKLKVAVKKVSHDSKQGMKEFIAEVVSIGRLQHRNLVKLLGYCRRKGELLLVYDYVPNGSLDRYLYGRNGNQQAMAVAPATLDWSRRFRIIKGIACGLLYLHEEWEKVVIHRDIKVSNVLLDDDMNARLGDFGLARLYDHGVDPQTTHVVGTIGYLAPELACTGKATPLTDVFAFGVFVLEVACGRRPIKHSEAQQNRLVLFDWVFQHLQNGSLTDAIDGRLKGDYDVDEACLALKLGLLCSHPFASARPSMRQVMQYLHGDVSPPELAPTHQSFEALALMQEDGFDPYIMSYPSSTATASIGTVSATMSQGR